MPMDAVVFVMTMMWSNAFRIWGGFTLVEVGKEEVEEADECPCWSRGRDGPE